MSGEGLARYGAVCEQVWVEIYDVNDNAPRFPEDRIVHQLSEAAEVGSTFVVPAAVDPDSRRNGVARYELRPARDSAFRLSVRHNALVEADSDLRVVLVDKLDREVNDRYQVGDDDDHDRPPAKRRAL